MAQESTWKFRPGMVPAYRQMFYQLCDVEEDSVQKMLHSNDKKVINSIPVHAPYLISRLVGNIEL